ncbi:MAG: flagellar assembly protein FliH [Deltaproteobacteria bacterium]
MSSDPRGAYPFPVFAGRIPASDPVPVFERFDAPSPEGVESPAGTVPAGEASLSPDLRAQIEMIGKEAYEKAFALGEQAGRDLGEAAVASMVEKLARLLDEISALRPMILREAERELVELSFRIARAIVGAEIETHPDIVLEAARRAIQRIGAEGRITLRVHPSDADNVWKQRDLLFPYLSGKGDITVEPDDSIERGGCLAVTDDSEADATLSGQFEALREHLRKAREKSP